MLPDFTKPSQRPVLGDTLVFTIGSTDSEKKTLRGVVSDGDVRTTNFWTVKTDEGHIHHVHIHQIIDIERGPGIPEYIPKK